MPKVKSEKALLKLDMTLLVIFPVLAALFSLATKPSFLLSIFLFYGFPALWLTIRTPKKAAKAALFSLILATPMWLIFDYMLHISAVWYVPTIFPLKVFNLVPLEDLIFGFFLLYTTVIYYEHFFDKGKKELLNPHMKSLLILLTLLLISFFTLYLAAPGTLILKYPYIWLGLFLIGLPAITFLVVFPKFLTKFVKTSLYFFGLAFLYELTALQLGWWEFTGTDFIGWIEIFKLRFPVEELLAWFILATSGILAYFEFFDDDKK